MIIRAPRYWAWNFAQLTGLVIHEYALMVRKKEG